MSLSIEQLREMSERIARNPDAVDELDESEAVELCKYIHPLGNVIPGDKTYVNMSLLNLRDRYMRRLLTTALIGYLYRTLEEYDPTEDANVVNPEQYKKLVKSIIQKFLNRNFDYNPDKHLRGSHTENKDDPERVPKDELLRNLCANKEIAARVSSKIAERSELTTAYLKSTLVSTHQVLSDASTALKTAVECTTGDQQTIIAKKYREILGAKEDIALLAQPLAHDEVAAAATVNPPVELYHQFDRYLTNHYEPLRDLVKAFYNEKPDIEFAVILYDAFDSAEDARAYRMQHENEFRSEVFTVENSGVTLLGPFKENRERADYYNKHTEILKRMMEQNEADHKLGKDIMEKQVRQKKRKNIEEAGADDPGLSAYRQAVSDLQELGAKKVLSQEELDKMAEAERLTKTIRENYEVPDDALRVDMYYPNITDDGTELVKTHFYTQAEAPVHMQDGGETSYQPKHDTMRKAYTHKTITDKTGEKKLVLTHQ